MQIIEEIKPEFEKVIEYFKGELNSIRTGQANPAFVEGVFVEAYGAPQPLKAVASITLSDLKTIQIEAWDATLIKAIESGILKADLGITPNVDGKIIRLSMPSMTDETRQKMVKIVKEKQEEARIAIRQVREDAKKRIDKIEGIGEDEQRGLQKTLDEVVRMQNDLIEEIGSKKEEQITTI